MNDIEIGECMICGITNEVQHTTYKYNIRCDCHGTNHIEECISCKYCTPIAPKVVKCNLKEFKNV